MKPLFRCWTGDSLAKINVNEGVMDTGDFITQISSYLGIDRFTGMTELVPMASALVGWAEPDGELKDWFPVRLTLLLINSR